MKQLILKNIFEGKSSVYSSQLAFSFPSGHFTYDGLANKINSIAALIQEKSRHPVKGKVLLWYDSREDLLLVVLALLKLKMEMIIADATLGQPALLQIIDAELPDMVIFPGRCFQTGIPVQCLAIDPRQVAEFPHHDISVTATEVISSMRIDIYEEAFPERHSLNATCFAAHMSEMSATLHSNPRDNYLITGEIPCYSWIVESLYCLFNGIHLLLYPFSESVVTDLLPDEERFPMDFTIFFFGSAKEDPDESCYELLMNCVRHADRFGYAGVWTPERHFNEFGGKYPNPSVLSAAIAACTSKVQIRTGSIVSPLHHVVRIAEDWSVIDNLSNGRTALSFASGWQCNDFVFFPERYATRHEVMMEQIHLFRKLWAGEKPEFNNGMGNTIKVGIYPRPVQDEMPIWITVSGKIDTFIDAGKVGANILTHLLWQDPSDLIEKIQAYRDSLKENGFDPASRKVTVMLHTYIGKSEAEVRKAVEKPLKEYISSSLNLVETMTKTARDTGGVNAIGRYSRHDEQMPDDLKAELLDFAFERFISHSSLLGDQAHCREIMKMLRSYGVDELACLVDFGISSTLIMDGLQELNDLKDQYSAAIQKKYNGGFLLRASRANLVKLIESRPDDMGLFRLIVTADDAGSGLCTYKDPVDFLSNINIPLYQY